MSEMVIDTNVAGLNSLDKIIERVEYLSVNGGGASGDLSAVVANIVWKHTADITGIAIIGINR